MGASVVATNSTLKALASLDREKVAVTQTFPGYPSSPSVLKRRNESDAANGRKQTIE